MLVDSHLFNRIGSSGFYIIYFGKAGILDLQQRVLIALHGGFLFGRRLHIPGIAEKNERHKQKTDNCVSIHCFVL